METRERATRRQERVPRGDRREEAGAGVRSWRQPAVASARWRYVRRARRGVRVPGGGVRQERGQAEVHKAGQERGASARWRYEAGEEAGGGA